MRARVSREAWSRVVIASFAYFLKTFEAVEPRILVATLDFSENANHQSETSGRDLGIFNE